MARNATTGDKSVHIHKRERRSSLNILGLGEKVQSIEVLNLFGLSVLEDFHWIRSFLKSKMRKSSRPPEEKVITVLNIKDVSCDFIYFTFSEPYSSHAIGNYIPHYIGP